MREEQQTGSYREPNDRAKQDARADAYREVGDRAKQDARAEPLYDRVILLLLLALFLLLSPIVEWWAADDSPWYAPYLLWALLIALTFWLQRRVRCHTTGGQRDN